jgi:hypothetical protein
MVGRHHTVLSLAGAALAIYLGALRGAGTIDEALHPDPTDPPAAESLFTCVDRAGLAYADGDLEDFDRFESAFSSPMARELGAEGAPPWRTERGGALTSGRGVDECDAPVRPPRLIPFDEN